MQSIHFTAADLARVSLVSTIGPIAETVFAMEALVRGDSIVFSEWHRQARLALGGGPTPLTDLRPVPDLLWLLDRSAPAEEHRLRRAGMTRQQVAAVVHEFHRLAVAPTWRRVRSYLKAERDVRARILTTGGIGRLLATVHPKAQWRAPTLTLPLERHEEVRLGGRGLVLAPSLFLPGRTCVVVGAHTPAATPILVFPAPPNRASARLLWAGDDQGQQALPALIGRTRAALLEALTETRTTGELAVRIGISAAGVSQHTSVLRQAGLITTRRSRNTVLHSLTTLGIALLDGNTSGFRPPAELGA
ncbi:winged helix-turn-helix domain-containing protein [Actinoplanes sp. NPDC049548]|uniref:ArsR/SmtB family transcription factor n=1 Tax=Actinoplanes sp. NPDC049548 TaxID=3155152 RepID=UPI003430BD81